MPSISAQVYNDQVFSIREESATAEAIASSAFQKPCTVCEKTFLNHTAYQNHFKSQGHAQEVARLEAKDDLLASMECIRLESEEPSDALGSEATLMLVPSICLFCKFEAGTLDLNIDHMQSKHGLFIPDQEYLVDLESFVGYLFTVITNFNECLYCGSIKNSAEAARQHMMSKGHCKLKPDPGSEYEDFYDVASDVGASNLDTSIEDKENTSQILVATDNSLHLLSGRILGHRSQARYYRQHTPIRGKSAERNAIEDSTEIVEDSRNTRRQLATTRARGDMGMTGVPELQKRALRAVENKMLKMEVRARNHYRAGLEKMANRQKYYRVSTSCCQ